MSDKNLNASKGQNTTFVRKLGKMIVLPLVFIIPVTFVAYRYFTAPPPGWCAAQGRLLTDKEYVEFVVPKLNDGQKIVDSKPVINCCGVDRQGGVFGGRILSLRSSDLILV